METRDWPGTDVLYRGHQAATYEIPGFGEMVEKAIRWVGQF